MAAAASWGILQLCGMHGHNGNFTENKTKNGNAFAGSCRPRVGGSDGSTGWMSSADAAAASRACADWPCRARRPSNGGEKVEAARHTRLDSSAPWDAALMLPLFKLIAFFLSAIARAFFPMRRVISAITHRRGFHISIGIAAATCTQGTHDRNKIENSTFNINSNSTP